MVVGRAGFKFQNWAQTYGSNPELYFQPTCAEEVKEILDLARQRSKRVKVVGGGHSPSDIACTDDFMIRLDKMNKVLKVKRSSTYSKIVIGWLLSDPHSVIALHSLSAPRIGAVSEVAAAGVIGTGTHNTGISHGILPTQVLSLTMMTASGEILECSESVNADIFQAARLHLGSLGVILNLTLQCRSAFRLQEIQFSSPLQQVLDNLDSHLKASEYFRFYWFPHTENVSVYYQDPTDKPPSFKTSWFWDCFVGYYLLELLLWISTFISSLVPTINRFFFWLLFSGRSERVDISYKVFNFDCRFKQHVQDWAIPIKKTSEALMQLKSWLEKNPHVVAHFPVEVRFARGDDILLSPCYNQDSCYMNIIMYRPYGKDVPHGEYWLEYEQIMKRVGGRPHWAKAHTCTRKDFEKMYPAFNKFKNIREKLDPTGMFLNAYLEKVLY
ncbi:PREDICTED: L-gulonolactone oxidase-like [Nanorana parkeri]|uniref:L-gulonolactone oxidase-like n=1 Tax=Nanorana parkeri TaxID=125878 RepID=UPI0008547955|nr:PREDICTED: L-gulonolactone oxidase-like [Nanorana parkeri]